MNRKSSGDSEPPDEALHSLENCRLKALVAIVNREDGERAVELFGANNFRFHFTIFAEGTSRSTFMNLIGLGSSERTIAVCVSHSTRIAELMPLVAWEFDFRKPGNGIAFTIPLSGINVFYQPMPAQAEETLNTNMEKEVDKMSDAISHDLILALVNLGYSEELVSAARSAGAKGGTVVNARRTGMEDAVKFFGITVQEEREVVAILASRENKAAIMGAINDSFGVKSPAHGIVLSLPVDNVCGLGS